MKKIEETGCKEGILFIDEINCVSENAGSHYAAVSAKIKTFGTHPVPSGWIIAAAGKSC